ncbi:Methyl-accepting chemotaxis protein III [BD1-7 clade bacterium]|uniref:Methyl-accepting chemotaxis protein III n=1 Tax=BD1-7 clade bacterium TaxID=2029982 RepID=A0A5S9N673_9GAMM|nr:Methyl-accepting chemotaxis protein III [BD1-7 clade bacterium]CAA0085398.1 Methyl-accepting chemotaxis protein III [BD1-7 clade bacterium]
MLEVLILTDILDRSIGPALAAEQDSLYKSRLLVGSLWCFIASVLGFFPFFILVDSLPDNAIWTYSLIALPLIFCWLMILSLLKKGRAYRPAAHAVIVSLNLVLFSGICVTGGPAMTEVHPLLLSPVIFAFLLLGYRDGLIWSMTTLTVYLSLGLLQIGGMAFLNIPPESARYQLRLFNFVYAFIICTALVLVYDAINRAIAAERDDERNRLQQLALMAINSAVINDSAVSLQQNSDDLLQASIDQKTAIEELATTSEQLGATAEQNSSIASQALGAINSTSQHVDNSLSSVTTLTDTMQKVQSLSHEIQSINNIINDIAYQTNLLSLNAMIEASRTSENGGFKVVALEVKKLAERSADAASTINRLLQENTNCVSLSVSHTESIKQCLDDVSDQIEPLIYAVGNIADASTEQVEAIRQINAGLNDVDRAVDVNRKLADHANSAAKALKTNTDELNAEFQKV